MLLATVPAGSTTVNVGIPPNAESLIIVTPAEALATDVAVAGSTTGLTYVGRRLLPYAARSTDPTWVFDISAALDSTVIVSCAMVDALKWYVYSDSAVHLEATTPALTNNLTAQYAIPIPPNTAAGDHPPVELQYVGAVLYVGGPGTVLLPPAGAGRRYRVFHGQMIGAGAAYGSVTDSVSGSILMFWGSSPGVFDAAPSGVALSGDAGVSVNLGAGASAGNTLAAMVYTTEAV